MIHEVSSACPFYRWAKGWGINTEWEIRKTEFVSWRLEIVRRGRKIGSLDRLGVLFAGEWIKES